MKDKTNLRRAGIAVASIGVLLGIVLAGARCSRPATIAEPVDTRADLNAAAAAIDAIAAWDADADRRPLLLEIRDDAVDPAGRIVTVRLASGEVVEIAVVADPQSGRWAPQNRPQPGPPHDHTDPARRELLDSGIPRPGDLVFDPVNAAWRWLNAHLTGDDGLAGIIAAPGFSPPPPAATFVSAELDGVTAPVELPAHNFAFFGFDFRTVDSDSIERSWRTWIGVRNVAGEWIVEGFFPLKPIPPPVS